LPLAIRRISVIYTFCLLAGGCGDGTRVLAPERAPGPLTGIELADAVSRTEGRVLVGFVDAPRGRDLEEIASLGGAVSERFTLVPMVAATVPLSALPVLVDNPRIAFVEPDAPITLADFPNDPYFEDQWGLENTGQGGGTVDADIDALDAWSVTMGSPDVLVALTDSGVQLDHPDYASRIWTNAEEVPGNGVDDEGNGYVDDIRGWDFYHMDPNVYDSPVDDAHGTHVMGILAAQAHNGLGVSGMANASVMPLKFVGPGGVASASGAIKAIQYAADKGAAVINASWGTSSYLLSLKLTIEHCDCLFVAAAGNGGPDEIGDDIDTTPYYPAGYSSANILSVTATDSQDALAPFANYGAVAVDLAAPGVDVFSTLPNSQYGYWSGTSMAAPLVAGTAVLLLADQPTLTVLELRNLIFSSVDPVAGLTGITVTGGRLNAGRALGASPNLPPIADAGPDVTRVDSDDSGSETISLTGSSSYDPDGVLVDYTWRIGTLVLGTGSGLVYPFAVGTHTVTLTVTDNRGAVDSDDVLVVVGAPPPPPSNGSPGRPRDHRYSQ
jgi:subtilisin family serine protease